MNQSFSYNDQNQQLHEAIDVDITFSRQLLGHCKPIAFRCASGREVLIKEVGLIHPRYDGLKTTFAFDVTDGSSDYRLVFDSQSLNWFLEFEGDNFTNFQSPDFTSSAYADIDYGDCGNCGDKHQYAKHTRRGSAHNTTQSTLRFGAEQ